MTKPSKNSSLSTKPFWLTFFGFYLFFAVFEFFFCQFICFCTSRHSTGIFVFYSSSLTCSIVRSFEFTFWVHSNALQRQSFIIRFFACRRWFFLFVLVFVLEIWQRMTSHSNFIFEIFFCRRCSPFSVFSTVCDTRAHTLSSTTKEIISQKKKNETLHAQFIFILATFGLRIENFLSFVENLKSEKNVSIFSLSFSFAFVRSFVWIEFNWIFTARKI